MRHRLKLHRAYLIGPMDRAREQGRIWREELEDWLASMEIISFNPYKKPIIDDTALEDDDSFELRTQARARSDWDAMRTIMKPVRNSDLRMCDHADFIISYLNLDHKMCGTWEELFTSNSQKKPIVVMMEGGKKEVPDWLFSVCPHEMIFGTWDEVKEYIRHIDQDEHINPLGRWRFFDIENQIKKILNGPKPTISQG